jgi:tRNA pseudouridine55 synthase
MKTDGYHIEEYNFPVLKIRLDVWSGTYIRSIAHRLGKQAQMWGILTQLRRTRIGKISLENLDLQDLGDSGLKGCEVILD